MSSVPRVLLLGGHGKIALFLTPLLLARGWDVISAVRDPKHESDILKFNRDDGKGGKVTVSISDLEKVKSSEDAAKVITAANPDYVVWAAGAGGKGPVERTYAIDQEAAKHFIHAAMSKPSITKFLLISHIGSRRKPAPWWTAADWESVDRIKAALPDYYKAKLDADEYFSVITAQRKEKGDTNFQGINLRPTTLSDDPATKKVEFGRTGTGERAPISREDVAIVADKVLARSDIRGYQDLIQGNTPVDEAIEKTAKTQLCCFEGEDLEAMREKFKGQML
ncbi:NAD dependent epimerase/dehydratase family protein [Arthroderma uncinatum]|uniref:NAD dependent epimerase/dehydratase family protein n=1 Tax=Arthroderma uncinatum TaxID=74035 RepID=UPI00144AE21C|nr:NAD dependent epimerase/dehydratase family protein [Arthroderma uncinatum]KAF3481097.1 NAD dependent epimerase/dehydratase family protein [Arthroderma uncinatum]